MRAAVYTRISEDQTGYRLGVQRQSDDCMELARKMGWTVTATFTDNDKSATNGKPRPGFEALLSAMTAGDVDAVIAWHPDRLYRKLSDLSRLLDVAKGVEFRTVTAGELDLATPTGRMVANILGSVATAEVEHKAERQCRANEQKAAAGKWQTANRPFGYEMDGRVREAEAALLRAAVADVLAGKSLQAVARDWNVVGVTTTMGTPWNSRKVRAVLISPRYAALKVHRGQVVGPGDWTSLIDPDTHRGIVAFLTDPVRTVTTGFERKHMGTGVYRCGRCGGPMKSCTPAAGRQRAYTCRDHGHIVRQRETLDAYVEQVVLTYLAAPETRRRLTAMMDSGERVDVAALHTQRAALQSRLDNLAGMFAAGDIDASQLRRGTVDLRRHLAEVDSVLADLARKSPVANLIGEPDAVAEHWEALTPDLKGKVIDELLTVTVLPSPRGTKGFHPQYVDITPKV